MARIRSIKPEFWKDELVASWPPYSRLAYIGMWNEADDAGRLRADPRYLLSTIFPYEPELDMPAIIGVIIDSGRLVVWRDEGETYGHLPNFAKHQVINKATESRLPTPPVVLPERSRRTTGVLREGSRTTPGRLPGGKEGKGREQGREQGAGTSGQQAMPELLSPEEAAATRVLSRMNALRGTPKTGYRTSPELVARIRAGVTEEDLLLVVEHHAAPLLAFKSGRYYRPATLFGAENFTKYLDEARAGRSTTNPSDDPFDGYGSEESRQAAIEFEAAIASRPR